MTEPLAPDSPPITELTKGQRRVLGTLLEKALTTPEVYPLTIKALTTGCNQKSNRQPMTEYSEDDVQGILDELRALGLVAVVHTETGRTERFRHYVRKRFPWSEPQLSVMTELLLRGRQSLGDLRARASRMVPIDSLESLRDALAGLMAQNFVQANGPLERRGVEVDHGFYPQAENRRLAWTAAEEDDGGESLRAADRSPHSPASRAPAQAPSLQSHAPVHSPSGSPSTDTSQPSAPAAADGLRQMMRQIEDANRDLRSRIEAIEVEIRRVSETVAELVRDLRG